MDRIKDTFFCITKNVPITTLISRNLQCWKRKGKTAAHRWNKTPSNGYDIFLQFIFSATPRPQFSENRHKKENIFNTFYDGSQNRTKKKKIEIMLSLCLDSWKLLCVTKHKKNVKYNKHRSRKLNWK